MRQLNIGDIVTTNKGIYQGKLGMVKGFSEGKVIVQFGKTWVYRTSIRPEHLRAWKGEM